MLVYFKRTVKCCLTPIPLSICNSDGAVRKTSKSVLMKETLTNLDTTMQPDSHVNSTVYVVDLIALRIKRLPISPAKQ